ncbi:MAG: sporulation initiation inhibitor protein Soj [Candidatus Methylacidiphilales bacterium]
MQIVAVINQKGGVGKTTTAVNLSAALATLGKKTLLIDLDPQANATSHLGLEKSEGASLYGALVDGVSPITLLQPSRDPHLFAIPAEIDLAGCEVEIARTDDPVQRLRKTLSPLRDEAAFDFVILDCPPSLGILMTNALAAADALIIPVQCEYFALEGVSKILSLIERMRDQGQNQTLRIIGVLMTMYDARTRLSEQVVNEVQQHLPDKVFKTVITRSIRLAEAPSFGKTIFEYDPNGVGALAYKNLAREFVERTTT